MNRLLILLLLLTVFACGDDDDPIIPNEEEIITDLVYVLTPADSGATVTMSFSDPDGDGAQGATITVSDSLRTNTTYTGVLALANASDPANPENVTAEIIAEDEDHLFFFVPTGGLDATVSYQDADSNGNPVGILTEVRTGDASTGSLRIILRHEPDKSAGATISDPTGAGGETDIEVTFPVSITN